MTPSPRDRAERRTAASAAGGRHAAPKRTHRASGDESADTKAKISRGVGARQRVLQAALQVLDDDGLPGFTMEAVARRAGASKATLYRRWPTVGALMIDAMDATFQPFAVPDTGRVETDVAELLAAFVTLLEDTPFPRMLAAFIDAAERDPALRALHADLTKRRRQPAIVVLTRARDRGELPSDLDPEVVTDLLAAPFFYRRFIAHRPIPPDLVHDVIAHVLMGSVQRAANSHPSGRVRAARKSAGQVAPRSSPID